MSVTDAGSDGSEQQELLPFRNALADWDHVASDLVARGTDHRQPLVTIGIPTYRRADLLVDAVSSVLAQRFDRPYEILVVDNSPDSQDATYLIDRLPELKESNFRYFVNRKNTGMFGNFNRCIQLARGEWLAILNDDDVLDKDYLELMFALLDKRPEIDGLVCRKRYVDLRRPPLNAGARGRISRLIGGPLAWRRTIVRMIRLPLYAWHFRGGSTRRLRARQFFWGPIAGTGIGFVWRTRCSIEMGGFYPEEYPAADLWFYARFAQRWHLRQHRAVAATSRIAVNEAMKKSTLQLSLKSVHHLQLALARKDAPRWWLRFAPLVLARLHRSAEGAFGVELSDAEVEQALGRRPVRDRPYLLAAVRLLCNGWHPDPA